MFSFDEKLFNPVILTGHRKSGTSVFHRLFDNYKGINLYPVDISVLYAYFPCFTNNSNLNENDLRIRVSKVFRKSIASLNYTNNINNINNIDLDRLINIFLLNISNKELNNKSALIIAIYKTWMAYHGSSNIAIPFVFKETSQAIFFRELKKEMPRLKMISIIRDPRDNYAALKVGVEKYYSKIGEDNLATLASHINRVKMDLKAAQLNQKLYPDSFLAIRFEDLITKPEEIMMIVASFLGIEFDKSLLIPTILGQPYLGNSYEGTIMTGLSIKNIDNWKSRISDDEAMVIEYWLSEVMESWDYKLSFDPVESQSAFSTFYELYNCRYFYHDSFA
jgi:hypothetical protein